MRFYFLVDQMGYGGASRVASILINGLVERGHEVVLETDLSKPFNYAISEQVVLEEMTPYKPTTRLFDKIKYKLRCYRRHRELIKKYQPDVAIVFLSALYMQLYVATRGLSVPVIVSDHTSMSRDLGRWTNFVRHRLYGLADCATILTNKDAQYLGKRVDCKEVIYNPLTFSPISEVNSQDRRRNILCVGRVSNWKVKGLDRIIRIWGKIAHLYPDWVLEIAGPGSPEKFDELKIIAEESRCADRINFLGNIIDIQQLYRQSTIFALPSRVEGFPMALLEAMSQGCACVSFDIDGAISEIASNGKNCLIAADGDLEEFEVKLSELLSSSSLRNNLASNAISDVQQYSAEKFINSWLRILNRYDRPQNKR